MMTSWRSLFVTGALLTAVALFAPGAVLAQDDETAATELPPAPTTVTAMAEDFDEIKVTWVAPTVNDAQGPLTGFRVYYATSEFADTANAMGYKAADDDDTTLTLGGLKPAEDYYVHVAAVNAFGIGPLDTDGPTAETMAAPKPERVTGVMVMAGDEMLKVSWAEPYGGHDRVEVDDYEVQYRTSRTRSDDSGDWMDVDEDDVDVAMREAMIMDLKNGMSYDVQVRAMNDAGGTGDWSRQSDDSGGTPMAGGEMEDEEMEDEEMMETPALPLVGLLLLGAGLVAAGRRRLQQ